MGRGGVVEVGGEGGGRMELGEPRGAALFGGLDERGAPFVEFFRGVGVGGLGDGAFGADRDDMGGAEFGGFLEEEVEGFTFEKGGAEGDGPRGARVGMALVDGDGDVATAEGGDGAVELLAGAVKDGQGIAGAKAEDVGGVMGFGLGKGKGGVGWEGRGKVEAGH